MRPSLAILLVLLLFASAARASDIDAATVNTLSRLLTAALSQKDSFEVSSSQELKAAIEFEGDKQSLGCSVDATSCLAEVASAMGARYVVFGQVGAVADELFMTLQLFDSGTGKSAARVVVQRDTAKELLDAMPSSVDELIRDAQLPEPAKGTKHHLLVLDLQLQATIAAAPTPPNQALLWTGGAGIALGATALVGSGALYGLALASEQAAVDEPMQKAAAAHLDERDGQATLAVALVAGGAALVMLGSALAGTAFLVDGP